MKIFKESLQFFLIACLLIANFYVPKVEAKTLGTLKTELEEFKNQYEKNKQQQQLTEDQISDIKTNINSINSKIEDTSNQITSLNNEIIELNKEIAKDEEQIESILSFTQVENGESAYLEYIIGAKDFTDFIYRAAVSGQLTSYNDKLVEQYKNSIEENKQKTIKLNDMVSELGTEQNSLKTEMNKLQDRLIEMDDEALSIEDQINAKKSEIKVYEDKGCKDNENINTCGNEILPPDTSFWRPLVKGYISGIDGLYGPRSGCKNDSRLSCYHKGMDLSINGGSSGNINVYSAANGLVVYIVYWGGSTQCAGNRVYIKHNINGKIYTTGYLHLHSINVKVGQTVTKNTIIGNMGGFEWYDSCSTGAHLHFEISTGTFSDGTYETGRGNPTGYPFYLNLPSSVNTYWYDRTTRY